MRKEIAIVHYNTPELTVAAIPVSQEAHQCRLPFYRL